MNKAPLIPAFRSRLSRLRRLALIAALAAAPLGLAAGLVPGGAVLANGAHQGQPAYNAAHGNRFVRMGLNKSVIVRLPAAARDVIVGNPAIADAVMRSKRTVYLFGKTPGETNAFFLDANGQQILSLDIEVAYETRALQKLIRRIIPGTDIRVDTVGDNVVLAGQAKNPAEAKAALDLAVKMIGNEDKVLSTIAITGKEQVMLKVRVAELQREVFKQFGIDTSIGFNAGNFATALITQNPFSLQGSPITGSEYRSVYSKGSTEIGATLRAMERDGLLRTLAEPTLTAISGENARFLAGGEFPVPVGADDGEIKIEFKPFGVGLGFTPVVLSEGRISLRINTEVSELSSDDALTLVAPGTSAAVVIPSLKVRRAETTVEMPSGGSLVMAGLIQEQTRQQINGLPGIKNLPVLGTLFRSRDFQTSQTELVVIVTPYVVNPVNERQLATPLDHMNVATDRQTILFGRLNKVYGVGTDMPKGGIYHGNVGFIVE